MANQNDLLSDSYNEEKGFVSFTKLSGKAHSSAEGELCYHAQESSLRNIQQKDIVGRKGKSKWRSWGGEKTIEDVNDSS